MWSGLDEELARAKELLADVLRRLGVHGLRGEDIGLDGLEYPDGSPRYHAVLLIRDAAYPLLDKILINLLDYYKRDLSLRFRGILPTVGMIGKRGERVVLGEVLALAYLVREFAERGLVKPAALYISWFDERRGDSWDAFMQVGKALLATIYRVPICLIDECPSTQDTSKYNGVERGSRMVSIGVVRHSEEGIANPGAAIGIVKSIMRRVERDPAIAMLLSKVINAVELGVPMDALVRCVESSLR